MKQTNASACDSPDIGFSEKILITAQDISMQKPKTRFP